MDETPRDPMTEPVVPAGRHCWELVKELPGLRSHCDECYALYVQQDCWTLWALRDADRKPCCQKRADCSTCPVLLARLTPQDGATIQIQPRMPVRTPLALGRNKKICRYFELQTATGHLTDQPDEIVRGLQSRSGVMRCRLRGVHLDYDYVSDICISQHPEECVFLEDAQPDIRVNVSPA